MRVGTMMKIPYQDACGFLLPRHYSGRLPSISYSYGWYIDDKLVAVCTFGKPASNSLCIGVCGKSHSKRVYELNRLCRVDTLTAPLSSFVSYCLRELSKLDLIIVSYSDTAMGHNGYIYQACNFIYTGATARRTDKYTKGNKHSRHYNKEDQLGIRKVRSSKHRYVFFAINSRLKKKKVSGCLRYPTLPYPKGENSTYVLGEYLEQELVYADRDKEDNNSP